MSLIHEVSDLFKERKGSTSIHPTWKVIELRKVCEIQNGFAFQSSEFNSSEGVPLIRIRDILKHNPETYYRGSYNDSYIVEKGDLLVGMDGDFNHSLWKGPDALLNQRVCRIIPNQEILLTRFLYYGLGDYLKKINENTSSTTVKHLSSKSIGEIPFALPPLPEQQRIVAKLDEVFGHLDRVREKLDRIPELLKNFRQQVLTQAVTGELIQEEMEIVSLEEYLEDIKYGTSQKSEYGFEGIPILRIPNIDVEKGLVSISDLKYSPLDEKEYDKLKLKKGDILIIRSNGSVNLVGQSALIGENEVDFGYAGYLVRLRTSKILDPGYLNYILKSNFLRGQIVEMARSTSGVNNINTSEIKSLKIPFTNIQNQKRITERIEEIFAVTDKIEFQYQSLKAKIDQMPQAILAKAFRGELVAQDLNNDPTTEILKERKK